MKMIYYLLSRAAETVSARTEQQKAHKIPRNGTFQFESIRAIAYELNSLAYDLCHISSQLMNGKH